MGVSAFTNGVGVNSSIVTDKIDTIIDAKSFVLENTPTSSEIMKGANITLARKTFYL